MKLQEAITLTPHILADEQKLAAYMDLCTNRPNALKFVLRSFDQKQDENFVINSWWRSFQASSVGKKLCSLFKASEPHHFYAYQRALIMSLLSRAEVFTLEEQGLLVGWICYEAHPIGPTVHYMFVKQAYRSMGLGNTLIAAVLEELNADASHNLVYSHSRPPFSGLLDRRGFNYAPATLNKITTP